MKAWLSPLATLGDPVRSSPRLVLADQMVVSGSNFLAILLVGRIIPQAEFGAFALAYASVIFLANLHRAFVTQPLNVLGAVESPLRRARRLQALLIAHRLLLPGGWGCLALASYFFFPSPCLALAACAYLAVLLPQDLMRRYWFTIGDVRLVLRSDLVASGGQVFAVALAGGMLGSHAAGCFAAMGVPVALALLLGRRYGPPRMVTAGVPTPPVLREQLQFSGWLIATVFVTWAGSQLYPFMLADLGPTAVALFAASRNLLSAVNVIVQAVSNYLPTTFRRLLVAGQVREFSALSFRTGVNVVMLAGLLLLMCAVFAAPLLALTYGQAYREAAPLVVVLAAGAVFMALGSVVGAMALALGDNRSSFIANAAASLFTLTAGQWLVAHMGLSGAAIATSCGLAVAVLVQALLSIHRLRSMGREGAVVGGGGRL